MNRDRRTRLEALANQIEALGLVESIEGILADLEDIEAEEEGAYDNMPESIQAGERGDTAQEALSAIFEAKEALGEITTLLDTFTEAIETARA